MSGGIDAQGVLRYLCSISGVTSPEQRQPYGGLVPAWEVMRKCNPTVEVKARQVTFRLDEEMDPETQCLSLTLNDRSRFATSPLPPKSQWFRHPETNEPLQPNLTNVFMQSILCTEYCSSVPIRLATRLNFYHRGVNRVQRLEDQDKAIQAAGGIRGEFMNVFTTKPEGQRVQIYPLQAAAFGCLNEFFVRTMALINDTNLMNGVYPIPHDVCVRLKLPVFTGPPSIPEEDLKRYWNYFDGKGTTTQQEFARKLTEQFQQKFMEDMTREKGEPITHYVAIEYSHILTWPFHSKGYTAQYGWDVHVISHKNVPMFYLIDNRSFDILVNGNADIKGFRERWMSLIDARPLQSIGFEFLPKTMDWKRRYKHIPPGAKAVRGDFALRAEICYWAAPSLSADIINKLAPMMCPGFPNSEEWNVDAVVRSMLHERELEQAEQWGLGEEV